MRAQPPILSTTPKEELLLQIPGCTVNLRNYLFSLSMEDMNLTYGVSFSQQSGSGLTDLDSFLKEHSCFFGVSSSSPSETTSNARALNWAELAPKIEKYSAVLAQVQKGGAIVITGATEETKADLETETNKSSKKTTDGKKKCVLSKGLARVRAVSENTEKRSKTVLNIVEMGTGSAVGPISSRAGGKILATGPGKVLLDSIGAFSNFMDAAEAAEKKALSASSKAATKMVSERFGESAGEVTEDVFAIAGHAASTAFNIVKIRKAVDPASSVSSAMVKNAIRMNL
ncbi:hypothetical protein C5167_026305 [Papaver somniferum]|nr:hypothetical protein C5167_026305 [Papaver somniferum]